MVGALLASVCHWEEEAGPRVFSPAQDPSLARSSSPLLPARDPQLHHPASGLLLWLFPRFLHARSTCLPPLQLFAPVSPSVSLTICRRMLSSSGRGHPSCPSLVSCALFSFLHGFQQAIASETLYLLNLTFITCLVPWERQKSLFSS